MTVITAWLPRFGRRRADHAGFLTQVRQKTAFWMFVSLLLLVGAFGLLSPHHVFFNLSNIFTMALKRPSMVKMLLRLKKT